MTEVGSAVSDLRVGDMAIAPIREYSRHDVTWPSRSWKNAT
ncbi:hypothetical protein K6U06_20670 [Acidiferrimicrobium sp. IK]|nr:hypothetical protein [Acidiferrimicrobium sp. IK]